MQNQSKAHIALFIVALIYGANYIITKEILDLEYMQPFALVFFRVITGLVLFNVLHYFYIKERIHRKDFGRLFLCALFGVAINQLLFLQGLKYTMPINASLIMTTTPILVLVASAILLRERITLRKILGILIGATGAILLLLYGSPVNFSSSQLWGDIMIFINACSYGIYFVLVKPLMLRYHPITVVKWIFTIGIFLVLPFGLPQLDGIDWQGFPNSIWIAIAYVLIFTTFLTYLLNAYALKIVRPSVASIYIYLQPLLASTIALSLGKDEWVPEKLYCGLLIFIGVYLVSSSPTRKTQTNVTKRN